MKRAEAESAVSGRSTRRELINLANVINIIFSLSLLTVTLFAQGRNPERGFQAGNSHSISEIETVNLTNGNLLLNVPLGAVPGGRGAAPGYTVNLRYNSKIWNGRQELRTDGTPDINNNSKYMRELLEPADESNGGWQINSEGYYLNLINRSNLEEPAQCSEGPYAVKRNGYVYKLQMYMPDGGVTEFRPYGNGAAFEDLNNEGYFPIDMNGVEHIYTYSSIGPPDDQIESCGYVTQQITTAGMNYYSSDGSGIRLFIPYGYSNHYKWKMYLPDGRTVENAPPDDPTLFQRVTDRNGNKLMWKGAVVNGLSGTKVENEVGQFVFVSTRQSGSNITKVIQPGFDGELLETTVLWKDYWVHRKYQTTSAFNAPSYAKFEEPSWTFSFVDKIILPVQAGSLEYNFTYNASAVMPTFGNHTVSWGELKSITLPSQAKGEYSYSFEEFTNPPTNTSFVLNQKVLRKDLTYDQQDDGSAIPITERTLYSTGSTQGVNGITTADGGSYSESSNWIGDFRGYVCRITNPNGSISERIWAKNVAPRVTGRVTNAHVKTEFTSLPDASGNPVQTLTKDYDYDKNGNILEIREYDWVPYNSVPRTGSGANLKPSGLPSGLVLKRRTVNTYYNPTPVATDTTSDNPNIYANPSSPKLKNVLKSSVIKDGNNVVVSAAEFYYDDPNNKGNLTQVKTWDSWKNGISQPYSNPLTAANSVSVATQYDVYGNPTLITDAKGVPTKLNYGTIVGPSSAVTDLYPTETIAAFGTALERSSNAEYDFSTGLVTRAVDINGVASEMVYDAIGRPLISKAAVGTAQEIWSQTEYNEAERRVITRSDLFSKGDGAKVVVQHFDQLGRVRLSRTLEDPAQNPADETLGIKVQTRYRYDNPTDPVNSNGAYSLSSNPYRAATSAAAGSETTMGWSLSYSDKTGRTGTMKTFGGAALPAPFGSNSNLTGTVTTNVDADATTVTDQAGKQRRSITNALGQLIRVDEPTDAGLGTVATPNQPTFYFYDTLGNLANVQQITGAATCGGSSTECRQARWFTYDSLSRLRSASNPESGVINYNYDGNGNLLTKSDARNLTTTFVYDALNRVTGRSYSDGTTPGVSYSYDGLGLPSAPTNSKGKLTKVSSSVSETRYTAFDALGRIKASQQITDGVTYDFWDYSYNLAGALVSQKYPSGRTVRSVLDADGDLAAVASRSKSTNPLRPYASNFSYTAHGAVAAMQLGNNRWETTTFNNRLQPTQLGLGTTSTVQDLWRANFEYGTATTNNGNITRQTIVIPNAVIGGTTYNGFSAVQNYTYDSLNRLQSALENLTINGQGTAQETWKQTFQYDRFGNRQFNLGNTTKPTTATDGLPKVINPEVDPLTNRLKGTQYTEANVYLYDAAGNLTRNALGKRFSYDAENKQREFFDTGNGSATPNATYFYDGDGKRVKKKAGTETTIFVYDASGKLAAEYSTTPPPPPAQATTSYLTNDHLRSPRVITDQTGAVKSRRDFLPFGEEISTPQRTVQLGYAADNIKEKFTGKKRDSETGLDYFKARFYASAHGRFTSTDPVLLSNKRILNPQLWNAYSYVGNNPLRYVDPDGLERIKLGDSEEKIKEEMETKRAEKKAIDKNKSVPKEDRKKQISEINKQLNTLDKKLEGTKTVNAMLKSLDEVGERNGLQLSDFTLTTDAKNDFPGASPAFLNTIMGSQAFVAQDTPSSPKLIYIRTDTANGFYQRYNSLRAYAGDYRYGGAAILRHEQYHRDRGPREGPAFEIERGVLKKFENYFQNTQIYKDLNDEIDQGIANNP